MAWDMFKSALAEIFRNFGTAIKITIIPFLILIAMIGGIAGILYTNFAITSSGGPQFGLLMFFLGLMVVVVALILFAWTAISWHRAILMGENVGLIPSLSGLPIGRYIGNSILIGLILIIPAVVVMFFVGIVASSVLTTMPPSNFTLITVMTTLVGAVARIFLQFLWLRMAIILPAIAVDRAMGIGDGWSATSNISGAIFGVSVIMTVVTTGLSLALIPFQFTAPIIVMILQIPFNFLVFIFGISIVTEIYKRVFPTDDSAGVFE